MRVHLLLLAAALVWLLGANARVAQAQTQSVGKMCEPSPAVKQALQKLTEERWQAPIKQRRTRELATLKALLKAHPDDLFVGRPYQEAFLAPHLSHHCSATANDPRELPAFRCCSG